jgi:hypothetical protein
LFCGNDTYCFDVVALDPNPAATNNLVTHPHVKDDTLCAGNAVKPLHLALDQGRLADAFCLIRSVLTQYNPHNAHVSLDDWGNPLCGDCGCTISEDDRSSCEICGGDYCSDCSGSCSACQRGCCIGCLTDCSGCEQSCCRYCLNNAAHSKERFCPACLQNCPRCRSKVATKELAPHTNLCPTCCPPEQVPVGVSTSSQPPPISNPLSLEKDHGPIPEISPAPAG